MTEAIEIRPAGWRDIGQVSALEIACFGRDAWSVVEVVFALLAPNVRLKAVAGDQLIGLVIGERRPWEGCAWITTLGVHPDFQRRGIGGRLLDEAEARLAYSRLKLTVRKSNHAAIALYRKAGYLPLTTWERYYAGGEAGLVMEKRRAAPRWAATED